MYDITMNFLFAMISGNELKAAIQEYEDFILERQKEIPDFHLTKEVMDKEFDRIRRLSDRNRDPDCDRYILMSFYMSRGTSGSWLTDKDCESLSYLMDKVADVMEDDHIAAADRGLFDVVVRIREDIKRDPEIYRPLAAPVLMFLEHSMLMTDDIKGGYDDFIDKNQYDSLATYGVMEELKSAEVGLTDRKPAEIYAYLNRFVIGQETAKRKLATAVYGHIKRCRHRKERLAPDALLLIGPTGCGKTELVRRLLEVTGLPCVFTDASALSGGSRDGVTRESILEELYHNAGDNQKLAEQGIVFMDEFDKLLIPSISRANIDIHEQAQSQLLTMIEGSRIPVRFGDGISGCTTESEIDTSGILFILAGAFDGLEEMISEAERKRNGSGDIGFSAHLNRNGDHTVSSDNVTEEVLIEYGMKRELAGRIGSFAVLNGLKKEDYIRILREPEQNVIQRYKKEVALLSDAEFIISGRVESYLAEEAEKLGLGARGLYIEFQKIMRRVLYEAPDHRNADRIRLTMRGGRICCVWE